MKPKVSRAAKVVSKKTSPAHKPTVEVVEAEEQVVAPPDRRAWYIALLSLGLVLLGVSTAFALSGTMPGWEQRIFSAVNGANLPGWVTTQLAKPISNAVWGMVGLVVLLLIVPKYRWRAWQYAVAGGGSYVLAYIIEHIVGRARPAGLAVDAMLRAIQDGPGFPSGHVAVITGIGLTMWFYVAWPWRILIALFILAVGWSRVFLGVHAPLDTVGGVAVGMIVVSAIHLLPARMRAFFKLSA